MMRRALVVGMFAAALGVTTLVERSAQACGGCFTPPPPPANEMQNVSDITDERMLFVVSPQQTTLYDQIIYSGNPATFAWVLPIRGAVTVGLSADLLFDSVDAVTATDIVSPTRDCPTPPACSSGVGGGGCGFGSSASAAPEGEFNASSPSGGASEDLDAGASVTITKQQIVGPYETVQLSATSPMALETWLATNGFDIPSAVAPVIAAYQQEGFGFLAMKLEPGQGVQAMRPVRVTTPGASLSLPLRMASIGTGTTTGITIWVVADGRYEPQNFPFFHIDDSQLVWDWSTQTSNYTTLRAADEAQYGGKGWEIESSISVAQQTVLSVINSGGVYGTGQTTAPPADASEDYAPVTDSTGAVLLTPEQVRAADEAALFAGLSGPNATITRIRSDIAHSAMTVDFAIQASADQSQLANVRNPAQQINLTCPVYGTNCAIVGYAAPSTPSSGGHGGSCATTASSSEPSVSLAAIAGVLVFAAMRPRRKR